MINKNRIYILDSFRAIAIIAVMLYHYFSRFTFPKNSVSLYPYNDEYDFFRLGYLGVEFFFIISGFVIFFTLENTKSFPIFWVKRFIRLVPPIIICSIITFVIVNYLDVKNIFPYSHDVKNFLPSISFISPQIFNSLTSTNSWGYIDGSYWSLWPEVQFYLLSSLLYFYNKDTFIKNFMIVSLLLILGNTGVKFLETKQGFGFLSNQFFNFFELIIDKGFNLINYLPFFCLGFTFYILYKNYHSNIKTILLIKFYLAFLIVFVLFIQGGLDVPFINRLVTLIMILLFFAFIYKNNYLYLLENKFLIKMGECSYIIYLIHQNIGVVLIFYFGVNFMPYGFAFPIVISIILIIVSYLYANYIDNKIGRWLKEKLIKKG